MKPGNDTHRSGVKFPELATALFADGKETAPPWIMGVLNITPDSFSDGGEMADFSSAMQHAEYLHESGSHIIDIGGESTAPNRKRISAQQELERIEAAVKELAPTISCLLTPTKLKPPLAVFC